MLAMLMNEDYNKYYDWQRNQILFDVIRSRINSLSNKLGYSPQLISLVQSCLEKDEYSRSSVMDLHSKLKSHSESFAGGFNGGQADQRGVVVDNKDLYS